MKKVLGSFFIAFGLSMAVNGTTSAMLNHNKITLIEQQSNHPELTETVAPTSGNPWDWQTSGLSGFSIPDDGIDQNCDGENLATGCCGQYTGGITGNTNCSEDGKLTQSDITRLIDRVYISKDPLCCEATGKTNASTDCKITLSDITVLIDAVDISKTPPAECLPECEI